MLAAALLLGLVVSRLSLATAFVAAVALVLLFAGSAQFALTRYGLWQASAVPIVALVLTFVVRSIGPVKGIVDSLEVSTLQLVICLLAPFAYISVIELI